MTHGGDRILSDRRTASVPPPVAPRGRPGCRPRFLWSEARRTGAMLDERFTLEAFGRAVAAQPLDM